jgi:hypothetical protein
MSEPRQRRRPARRGVIAQALGLAGAKLIADALLEVAAAIRALPTHRSAATMPACAFCQHPCGLHALETDNGRTSWGKCTGTLYPDHACPCTVYLEPST